MAKDVLTTAELAERWNVTAGWLRQLRFKGDGPPYFKANGTKAGKALYCLADITAWEEAWEKKNSDGNG